MNLDEDFVFVVMVVASQRWGCLRPINDGNVCVCFTHTPPFSFFLINFDIMVVLMGPPKTFFLFEKKTQKLIIIYEREEGSRYLFIYICIL